MSKRTCTLPGCDGLHQARGLCMNHYIAARKQGLENLPPNPAHHLTSNINIEAGTLDCQVCGPSVPLKVYGKRGAICATKYLAWRNARKVRIKGTEREYKRNPESKRQGRYGLEPGELARMLGDAGGCCEICRTPITMTTLHVDHDHGCCPTQVSLKRTCGKCTRGLLCGPCNLGLGQMRDSPEILLSAAEYVLRTTYGDQA